MMLAHHRMRLLAAVAWQSRVLAQPAVAAVERAARMSSSRSGGSSSGKPKRAEDTARFLQGLAAEAAAASQKRAASEAAKAQRDDERVRKRGAVAEDLSHLRPSEQLLFLLERQIKEIEDSLRLDQRAFANLDLDPEAERKLGDESFSVDEDQAFTLARLAQADALGLNLRERPRNAKAFDDEDGASDDDDDEELFDDDEMLLDDEIDDSDDGDDDGDEEGPSHPGMLDPAKMTRIATYLEQDHDDPDMDDISDNIPSTYKPKRIDLKKQYKIDIDHKNMELLSNFVSDTGRIVPARQSGLAARSQRKVARMIKRARHAGLMPYMAKLPEYAPYEHVDHKGLKDDDSLGDFMSLRRDLIESDSDDDVSDDDSDDEAETRFDAQSDVNRARRAQFHTLSALEQAHRSR